MKKIVKNAMILFAITLVSGLALGFAYELTKEPIAVAEENRKQNAYKEVIADADSFTEYSDFDADTAAKCVSDAGISNCTIDEVVTGMAGSDVKGYIITVTDGEGYNGDIQFTVGVGTDGKILGISFLSISESPGLGMTAKDDPSWKEQYYNKDVSSFTVVKSSSSADDEINAISGATISSKAITNGVNAALAYYNTELGGAGNDK